MSAATARAGLDGFAADVAEWTRVAAGRVPSYVRVLDEVVALPEGPIRAALAGAWAERRFDASYDRPLLLLASLRAAAFAEGPQHPLWAAIAAEPPQPASVTPAAVAAALAPGRLATYGTLRARAVQTNETSRAVVWLWPAALLGAGEGQRPLALVDLGASAGLNLVADRLPAIWRDEAEAPLPVARAPHVARRLGLDRQPLDVREASAVAWLEACVWPGERARLERLRAAVAAMRAALAATEGAPRLAAADAADMPARLAELAATLPPGTLVLAYQTIFIDYLPAATRAAYAAGMQAWLARTPRAVWLTLEQEPDPTGAFPAGLRACLRGRGADVRSLLLARCGYHPSVLSADPGGVAELLALAA